MAKRRVAKPKARKKSKAKRKPAKRKPIKRVKKRPAKPLPPRSVHDQLLDAFDLMQDLSGALVTVRNVPATVRSRTPWLLVGRFKFDPPIDYDDLGDILLAWRDSIKLENLIDPQRLSRLQVEYVTSRSVKGQYTIAEIGPWGMAISRAYERVVIQDDRKESLIERYGNESDTSELAAVYVWFSSQVAKAIV